jgi:hypothetical protein
LDLGVDEDEELLVWHVGVRDQQGDHAWAMLEPGGVLLRQIGNLVCGA